ncbi:pentapeptide repeat-containing protein [Leptolyngbya sp. ST-U4]|uniref:pentapeptide repeat-containing protein n=1 Tax=Leptolyngbya sp. ST-U4 TaxID=2933912 RepID=UPI0019B615AB|nr:pentapeptide repeat-containing protein [Cyanobacteria bacterium FACHB-502]
MAAGLSVAQLEGKAAQNFRFLRLWTIALAACGGTSFYDLDVSNVDFSGANLANSDFRVRSLHRSILKGVTGLELARVDSRYLDLGNTKVQKLLTQGISCDRNFSSINLRGAYIPPKTDLRDFDFTCANLTGANLSKTDLRDSCLTQVQATAAAFNSADLRNSVLVDANCTEADFRGADLRGSILVRAQVARADFTGADMTGVCIEDWSVSSKTCFTNVRCDYIFRKYQDGEPIDRYPADRYFEPGEFAALYAEPEDVVELVFKGEFNIAALSLALYKLQTDAPELNLELRGIEQREDLWVAKIRSTNDSLNERLIEERLALIYKNTDNGNVRQETIQYSIYREYEETKRRLAESEQLISQLATATGSQAIALKELSHRSAGNTFNITDSNVGNIVGTGTAQQFHAADQDSASDRPSSYQHENKS